MNDLQLGLLGIGVAVVGVVVGYNKWQEWQYRRRAEAGFRGRHPDVLMQQPSPAGSAEAGPVERIEPVFDRTRMQQETPAAESALLSEAIDFIIPIEAEGNASQVYLATNTALVSSPKRVIWEGFDDDGIWEPLRSGVEYSRLRVGMQMVDRRGGASAEDLREFASTVEQAAVAAGAQVVLPDAGAAHERAAELDRFCGEVDIQVALHVVNDSTAFTGTKVRALAEAAGMTLENDGKYCRRDDAHNLLFTLANREARLFQSDTMKSLTTNGLTLELDVPRTPRGTFDTLQEFARQLSQTLGARIVDDNSQPLGPGNFDTIRAQLESIHRAMENRGIAAGGTIALRLFS